MVRLSQFSLFFSHQVADMYRNQEQIKNQSEPTKPKGEEEEDFY